MLVAANGLQDTGVDLTGGIGDNLTAAGRTLVSAVFVELESRLGPSSSKSSGAVETLVHLQLPASPDVPGVRFVTATAFFSPASSGLQPLQKP